MLYNFLWVLLFLSAILIATFHIKAHMFNRKHKNKIISSQYVDIWPYRLLRFLRLIALLLLLFFKGITVPYIIKNVREKIQNIESIKSDEPYDEIEEDIIADGNSHEKRVIINEETKNSLTGDIITKLIPITDGYYRIITDDEYIISNNIAIGRYRIPNPIVNNYCSNEDKFWNIFGNGVDYNGFIYDYINGKKKDKVVIAIIDSGIDTENKTLAGHVSKNKDEVLDGKDNDGDGYIDNINGINIQKGNGDINDELGHGSHVAGIILQTFPNAEILPIKVSNGNTHIISELSLVEGIRYAIDHQVDIINLSLGSEDTSDLEHAIVKEATEKGILVVAAAGNEGTDTKLYFPAGFDEVTSVGSIGIGGNQSSFSNLNATTNLPGECIYSYGLEGPGVYMDGTSMSTPHLAGMFGAYKSLGNNIGSKNNIKSIINKSTRKLGSSNVLQISKLLGIEKENNRFYEYLGNINNSLIEIKEKLENIDSNALTKKDIDGIISYKKTLETNANNLGKVYIDLGIPSGFGLELKEEINNYISLLEDINGDNLYLTIDGGTLSSSLGTDICNGDYDNTCKTFSRIIRGGSNLPAAGNESYVTAQDYQTEIKVDVYQGENENVNNNTFLGTVTLSGLPRRLKGKAGVMVYFNVDKNGKLSVKAIDSDNSSNSISTTIKQVKRDVSTLTGEDYSNVVNGLNRVLERTKKIIESIRNFNNTSPFNYIPESIDGELRPYTGTQKEIVINSTGANVTEGSISPEEKETKIKYDVKENIKVAKVIDGDTIKVVINGETQNVRMIGVDSPENSDTRYGYTECYGEEAGDYLNKLLKNKYVGLIFDKSQGTYDKYDRLLAYVIFNGENINQKVIENGYGWEYTYDLPYKYQKEFKNAEKSAKEKGLGLWSTKTCGGKRIAN